METQTGWALIVDSQEDAPPLYRAVLGDLGLASEICDHGDKVALALARRGYDLIILNPHTPGVCAVEIVNRASYQLLPPALVVVGEPTDDAPAEQPPPGDILRARDPDALRATLEASLRARAVRAQPARWPPGAAPSPGYPDLSQLYRQIVQIVLVALRADRISLMLWRDGSDWVTVAASAGAPFVQPGETSAPLHDSVSGWVIRHAEPLLIDPEGDLPFDLQGMWRGDQWCSGMCVPLIVRGQTLGVLAATRRRGHQPFTGADVERMLPIASRAAAALDSAQIYQQMGRRTQFLAQLNSLGAALMGALDAGQVLRIAVAHLGAALPGAHGYLLLREDDSPWFDQLIGLGGAANHSPSLDELRDDPGLAGLVLADGTPRRRPAAAQDLAAWERAIIERYAGQALLCAPLKTEQAVYGVIELIGQHPLDEEDLQFLAASAALVGPAIARARAQAAAERAFQRYQGLVQGAGDAVFVIDAGTMTIVEANPAAEQMSGYSQAELGAIAPVRLIAPGSTGRPSVSVSDVLAGAVLEYEGAIRMRSGYSVPVSIGVTEITLDERRHLLLIARNIAEQQHQASRQAQSEKLAGMARLTAAIAHQINNPLQALHNTLHLLLNRSFTDEKRERLLSMAQMEVDRLTDLVRRMLELHRPAHEDMRPVSVHGLIENALAGASAQIQQHHVVVERDWAERLPWVIGIGGHLRQVFQNLATNAVEAMPKGGRLVIRTRLDESAGAGLRVLVDFADSGPGIADSEMSLIFEPFYSTKRASSGLGLAISYSIVERHGGTLSVISDGEGTTFRVALPAATSG